ncbi:MAG TPA: FAD-dependent oxidoreductase [Chloroflexota bacterium]|nr:FAD-dependent oxidoreductase [Chloroflexota bacterium]
MSTAIAYHDRPPATAELVIVGGGVAGAATAFYAARAGLHPVLLERRPALATLTTAAATGGFRLQFESREELELVRESVELFLNFASLTGQATYDPQVRQQGYLWVTTEEAVAERQRQLVARQHTWGQQDVELLGGAEARRRFPYLSERVIQARFRQGDGFLDPRQVTLGLAAGSRAAVVTGCGVTGFRLAGGRLVAVETTAGRISTPAAVIACGPLSGPLATTVGLDLPLTTVRRQKVILPDLPAVPADAPMTIDEDTGVHWRPALRGAYLLFTDPATPPSPPAEEVPTDSRFAFRLLDPRSPIGAARVAPFWRQVWEHGAAPWMLQAGQYTYTPDHRPLLGATEVEGLWVNSCCSGHGVMGSPAGSRLLVDLLTGRRPGEANPFRLDRHFVAPEVATL